jgi:hypothetical protein
VPVGGGGDPGRVRRRGDALRAAAATVVVVALAGLLAGCQLRASPEDGAAVAPVAPDRLFVADALGGAVVPLDAAGGRVAGPALPAGAAPWALAPDGQGGLLVLGSPGQGGGALTHLRPAAGGWLRRPLPVAPGARGLRLAGDGERSAVLAYAPPAPEAGGPASGCCPASGCWLAHVDVPSGTVTRRAPACGGDTVTSLALGSMPGGPIAYLGLWRGPGVAGGQGQSGSGLLLAVDAATGLELGAAVLPGPPGLLVAAPAPGGAGRRLYAVEGTGGAERLDPFNAPDYLLADRWRLVALHPVTLAPEGEYPLGEAPRALAVAPDGDHAYALAGPVHLGLPSTLLHLDLRTGSVRRLLSVPGSGVGGLALAGGYLFVPDPEGGAVSVVDPRSAAIVRTTRVGGAPLAIAAGHAWRRPRGRSGRPRVSRRRTNSP